MTYIEIKPMPFDLANAREAALIADGFHLNTLAISELDLRPGEFMKFHRTVNSSDPHSEIQIGFYIASKPEVGMRSHEPRLAAPRHGTDE